MRHLFAQLNLVEKVLFITIWIFFIYWTFHDRHILLCMEPGQIRTLTIEADVDENSTLPSTETLMFEDGKPLKVIKGNPGVPGVLKEGVAIGATLVYIGGCLVVIGLGVLAFKNFPKVYQAVKELLDSSTLEKPTNS